MGFTPTQPSSKSKNIMGEVVSAFGYIRRQIWTAPLLADDDELAIDEASSDSVITLVTSFLAQPDFARILTILPTGTTADVASGDYTYTGTNIRGEVITDTIAISANASTLQSGVKAFLTVTGLEIPVQDGADATFDLGVGDALGLDRKMAGNEVILATADGVQEGTAPTIVFSATAIESNTMDPDTSLDGAVDFAVVYISTEKTDKGGSSS